MEEKTVSELFDEGFDLYCEIIKTTEPTNSGIVQDKVRRAVAILEKATNLVSEIGIFSTNESVEEIATENIKFLLLPFLLGSLTMRITLRERSEVLETSEIYFHDYVRRCKDYGITETEVPLPNSEENEPLIASNDLRAMANKRNLKIQQFKERKELENSLIEFRKVMDAAPSVDEELKRKYHLTQIKLFVNESLEELNGIKIEKPLLEYISSQRKNGVFLEQESPKQHSPTIPLKPVIITRDIVQKKVFGAGYPSVPVYTVDEFYEHRVKEGIFPGGSQGGPSLMDMATRGNQAEEQEKEEAAKEEKVESDDPETLKRSREFDEFKDTHRRGYGNRMNRS